jgi:hypothetical protein
VTSLKLISSLAVSESGFVFLPTTGETFTVNEVGRVVLSALQNGKAEDEIAALVAGEYQIDPASFRRDFQDFLMQLKQYQLLESGE